MNLEEVKKYYTNGYILFYAIPSEQLSRRVEVPIKDIEYLFDEDAFYKFVNNFDPSDIEQRKKALALGEISSNSNIKFDKYFYKGCSELLKTYDEYTTKIQEDVNKKERYQTDRQQITEYTEDGILISIAKDNNNNLQPLTTEKVKGLLNQIDPVLRGNIKGIKICDYETSNTPVWRIAMMDPKLPAADAECEYNTGVLYLHPNDKTDGEHLQLIAHEAALCYDRKLGKEYDLGEGQDFSSSNEWKTAIDNDFVISGKRRINENNELTNSEDFAQSVSFYFDSGKKETFRRDFPNRYGIIDSLYKKYADENSKTQEFGGHQYMKRNRSYLNNNIIHPSVLAFITAIAGYIFLNSVL